MATPSCGQEWVKCTAILLALTTRKGENLKKYHGAVVESLVRFLPSNFFLLAQALW